MAATVMSRQIVERSPFWNFQQNTSEEKEEEEEEEEEEVEFEYIPERQLSQFERVVTSHPPVLESLLAQLPTSSLLDLSHTSVYLRRFLQNYPLAWRALSFRLPQPTVILGSPGIETPDSRERQSKQYALDALLIRLVIPLATRLKSLDLCNTAVSGVALVSKVLQPRIATLEHLSVRGCKNVSIKYHIVPFLQLHSPHQHPWVEKLALKSLYTYRCRHHRRRPYLPSSLMRRDSDSEPTHELIDLCHQLGIWTDTAWCPTPGGRCYRRKDYHGTRATPGTLEVWVPFDRLWRSGNRIGLSGERAACQQQRPDGRLWEDNEQGHDGEALGTENGPFCGEGKYLPAHLRKSHKTFVEEVKCQQCGDSILERCETCSIKMHCMGCRKTLCASCAFNRPIPRSRTKTRQFSALLTNNGFSSQYSSPDHILSASTYNTSQSRRPATTRQKNRFWWAPGASRSPNLMNELPSDSDSEDGDTFTSNIGNGGLPPPPPMPLKLNMHWCCLEPVFSGGGGVNFHGPGLGGAGSDRYRAVPLPKKKQYEDPDFMHTLVPPSNIAKLKNLRLYEEIMGENVDILPYLMQESTELQANSCPRSLCNECYGSWRWKVACRGCDRPLCKEHDFRALKVRKCGFRELEVEREWVRNPPKEIVGERRKVWERLRIPEFKANRSGASTPTPENLDSWEGIPSEGQMARIDSTTSSSAESSQLLVLPAATTFSTTPTDRPSSITDFDMTATLASLPPRSTPTPGLSSSSCNKTRQRSISLSGLADRGTVSGNSHDGASAASLEDHKRRFLLPAQPGGAHPVKWQGCGAYFCQGERPIGDTRGRCQGGMRECGECGVLVCEFCLQTPHSPPSCPCTFCSREYHCPPCTEKPSIKSQCVRAEELKAIELAMEREKERIRVETEARLAADVVAGALGEFLEGLNFDLEFEADGPEMLSCTGGCVMLEE